MADFSNVTDDAIREFGLAIRPPSMADRPFGAPLSEDEIQVAVFDNFRTRGAPNCFPFHGKNGGVHQRGKNPIFNAKRGVVSGLPDVMVLTPGQAYALELKTEIGRLSKKQIETLVAMGHCGVIVGVAYGLEDALHWLEGHGLLKGKTA